MTTPKLPQLENNLEFALNDVNISQEDVEIIFNNINIRGGSGSSILMGPDDPLHPIILKKLPETHARLLLPFFQESIKRALILTAWKTAKLIPIFTKGDRTNSDNYMPISRSPTQCKVMEKILKDKINDHIETNHLINSNWPCHTFADIEDTLNKYARDDAMYFDFKTACCQVKHKHLIEKLKAYNVSGMVLRWIESYLSDMTMKVSVNDVLSRPFNNNIQGNGFPSDSIIGPVLLLIYINDLLKELLSDKKLCAEDSIFFDLCFKRIKKRKSKKV